MAKELWFVGPHHLELRERTLAVPADHVLVRGLYSAVSHGTETLLVTGLGPDRFDPSLDGALQPTYPRRYGYAWVGRVQTEGDWLGQCVFALQPHSEAHALEPSQFRVVPSTLPPRRATLAAAMETALNAVWDAELRLGERVLVFGAGTIGLCVVHAALASGAEVTLVEPDRRKHETVRQMSNARVVDQATELGDDFDAVFEVTGNPHVLGEALAHCGFEARVVVVSFYGAKAAPVPLGDRFHRQRLRLVSSQVSAIAACARSRFDHDRRFEVVWQLLANPCFDRLSQTTIPFAHAPEAYAALVRGEGPQQIIFEY
jgi:threonine dehydrogenase-like Zn-dependent dehydrogenase